MRVLVVFEEDYRLKERVKALPGRRGLSGGEDVESKKQAEFVRLYIRVDEAANTLHAQAAEVCEMAKRIEELTKDTLLQDAGMRARVEARTTQEHVEDLRRALGEMGKELRGQA
jgi:hypothetical protein